MDNLNGNKSMLVNVFAVINCKEEENK